MNIVWVIVKKELKQYANSPMAFLLAALFVFFLGWPFFNYISMADRLQSSSILANVVQPFFGNINIILLFTMPLLTMGAFAEEKKAQTLLLLESAPITEWQIVLAKFFATSIIAITLLLLTLIFPLILIISGFEYYSVFFTGYMGLILMAMCFVSVGIFASSLTSHQIVAALLTFSFLFSFVLFILSANATENILLGQLLQYLSPAYHFDPFSKGVIKSYNVIFFITVCFPMLYFTKISLNARKW